MGLHPGLQQTENLKNWLKIEERREHAWTGRLIVVVQEYLSLQGNCLIAQGYVHLSLECESDFDLDYDLDYDLQLDLDLDLDFWHSVYFLSDWV